MVNVRRALRGFHGKAVRAAGTEVAVHRLTYASADDPFDVTQQHTVSETWRGRGTYAPETTTLEPVPDGETLAGNVTINARSIGWRPTQADRVEIGGAFFNIVQVVDVLGELYRLQLAGQTADPGAVADETPPRITTAALTPGETTFGYTATANEASQHRYRYRKPPSTGTWVTTSWGGSYVTSISGTSVVLDSGLYEVAIQPRDAAGNVGGWYDCGTVTITGVLGG